MSVRSVSPDQTPRKRPYDEAFDAIEARGSKRSRTEADQRIPGLFGKVKAGLPLSVFDRIQTRELGMGPLSFDPLSFLEKGKRLLAQGKMDEARQAFSFAKNTVLFKPEKMVPLLTEIACIEYDHQLYSDALETSELLAQNAPTYLKLANLIRSLCHFHLEKPEEGVSLLLDFTKEYLSWILVAPQSCPLSAQEYVIYRRTIAQLKPKLQEVRQHISPELDASFLEALFYLSLALNDLRKAEQILEELELGDGALFRSLYDLINDDRERKKLAFEYTQPYLIRWDLENFVDSLLIKLLFNAGLQTRDVRPLAYVRNNFLFLEDLNEESEKKVQFRRFIFFCHLALEQDEQALEVANSIEFLQPGSAAMLLTLCRLKKAETLTQDIVDDLKKCLEAKDPMVGDPSILQFIGDFILEKEMNLSLSSESYTHRILIFLSQDFYQWASSFHGQLDDNEMRSEFMGSQIDKFRDLYRRKQFEAALVQGKKLCQLILDNEFILLEMVLCLFQLGRSQEAIEELRGVVETKYEHENDEGFDRPDVDEVMLEECIPWLRSVGENELVKECEEWLKTISSSEESVVDIASDD